MSKTFNTNAFSSIESKDTCNRTVANSTGSFESKHALSTNLQKMREIRKRNSPLVTPLTTQSFGIPFDSDSHGKYVTFTNIDTNFTAIKQASTSNGANRSPFTQFTQEPPTRIETADLSPRDQVKKKMPSRIFLKDLGKPTLDLSSPVTSNS